MKTELKLCALTYGAVLTELGRENADIFVLEADLMKASGTRPFMEAYPDRHINVGVAEQNLVGIAAGLASMQRIPFACTMSNFMSQRASDQVTISVSFNKFNVKLIGCYAGLSQEKNGATHISIMDVAVMRCLPNMKVIVPSDHRELADALKFAAEDNGPLYIRMPRVLPEALFDDSYKFTFNKGYQVKTGCDLTIISNGISSLVASGVLDELEKEGINAGLVHFPVVKPADEEIILEAAEQTGALITVEDHSIYGGLGGLVSEITGKNRSAIVARIGLNDMFGLTASLDFQLDYFGISVENLIKTAKEVISRKK
jgi:transketolase